MEASRILATVETTGVGQAERELSGFGTTVDRVGGMAGKALGGLVVAGAAAGGIAIAAFAVKGVSAAGDLQQAVANISTIKPEIDTSAVFSSLNAMQTRVPQSAKELGDSLYNVFSSINVSQQDALKLTEEFARSAVGAGTSAETFGTAALGVMNAYGLAATDAAHISDVFFNTVNAGVVTGEELAGALGPVTQSARAAGVSLDELGGLVAGVTKEGGPAAQNINNLNNFLQKITTEAAQKQLNALGVATTDATGAFLPTTDVLTVLKDRLGGMTEAGKASALQAIFPDAQARIGAQTLLSQLDFVKGAIETNIESSGSAASAYEKMSATFNSQMELGKNALMSLATTVGGAVTPALTNLLTTAIIPSINSLNTFVQSVTGADDPMAALVTGINTVLPGFASFVSVLGTAVDFISANLQPILIGLGAIFASVLVPILGSAAVAFAGLVASAALVAAPFLAIGAAAVALYQAWQTNFGGIQQIVMPVVEAVKAGFGEGGILGALSALVGSLSTFGPQIAGWFREVAVTIGAKVLEWGTALIGWIAPYIPIVLARLSEFATAAWGWITAQAPILAEKLLSWGTSLINWVSPYIPQVLAKLGELAASAWGWITAQVPVLVAKFGEWGTALGNWVGPAIPVLLGKLGELASSAWGWVSEQAPILLAKLQAWGASMVEWIGPQIPILLGKAGQLASQFLGWIGEQAAPILTKLQTWAASFVAWVVPATTTFLQEWPGQFNRFLTWIGEQAGPLLAKLGDWALQFVSWIGPMIPNLLLAALGISAAILTFIAETAVVLIGKLLEWGAAFVGWIAKDVIPLLVPALGGIISTIGGWITGTAIPWAVGALKGVGSSLVDGIRAGISRAWNGLLGWIDGQVAMIPKAIRDFLGIGSPSKVMAEQVGQWIPAGIAAGIAGNSAVLGQAMGTLQAGLMQGWGNLTLPPIQAHATAGTRPGGTYGLPASMPHQAEPYRTATATNGAPNTGTIIQRQVVLNVSRPMNVENEMAGLDAWANAGRS